MDKAIEALEALLEPDADDRVDWDDSSIICGKCGNKKWVYIAEALSELTVYKAKIESLKEHCKKDIERLQFNIDSCVFIPAKQGYKVEKAIYADILQKLEELEQYHRKDR